MSGSCCRFIITREEKDVSKKKKKKKRKKERKERNCRETGMRRLPVEKGEKGKHCVNSADARSLEPMERADPQPQRDLLSTATARL